MNVPHKLCRHLQDMSFEVQHFLQWMGFCRNNERLSELFVKIVQHQPTKTFWNENSNNLDRFYLLWTAFIEAKISNFKRIIMKSVYCSQNIVWTWLLVHNKINIFTSLNAVSQDFSRFLQSKMMLEANSGLVSILPPFFIAIIFNCKNLLKAS